MMITNSPSEKIEKRLQAVRSRIRHVQKIRAATVVATVALGGLVILVTADYFLAPLPLAMRWGMSVAWLGGIVAAAWISLQPVLSPVGLPQVARWLEARHPEIEERLSTVLGMAHGGQGASSELFAWLAQAAEADLKAINIRSEVKTARTSRRWGRPALAFALVTLLGFLVWPKEASRMVVRALVPFSHVGNAGVGRFVVWPGDVEVFTGDAVDFKVRYDGHERNPEFEMRFEDGREFSQNFSNEDDQWIYALDPIKESFRYQARAGRDESDTFTIKVWPLPELLEAQVTLDSPSYTAVPAQKSGLGRGIAGVPETKVTLTGVTNVAVESAWLEINDKHLADGITENSGENSRVRFVWTLKAGDSGDAVLILKHRLGRKVNALRFHISVLGDDAPQVVILSPTDPVLHVTPNEVLALKYEVTEDLALAKVALEIQPVAKNLIMIDQTLPVRQGDSKPSVFRGDAPVSLGEMKSLISGTNELRVRVRAEDGRPADLGGPGVGFSGWMNLRLDEAAESLARQALRKEQDGATQTIEQAIQAMSEVREQMDRHREQINASELNDAAQKELNEAHEKLVNTREALRQLSNEMKQSVHAPQSDEVENAADEVAKARENLETSRLQDTRMDQDSMLVQARDHSEAAVKSLTSVKNAIDRQRGKVEDLAQLQDLAQQQKEVARQAEADLTQQPSESLSQDWQENQKRVKEALRSQLRGRPEAKAGALKSQAQQATLLAQQAAKMAKIQQTLAAETKPVSDAMPPHTTVDQRSALQALEMTQVTAAEELAHTMANLSLIENNDSITEAEDCVKQASQQAKNAADQWQKEQAQEASEQHDQSSRSFDQSASALTRAAGEFAKMAEEAASETADPEQAEANAGDLATAFEQASQAADNPQPAQAAAKATSAAQAMDRAAQSARQKMQGRLPKPTGSQRVPTKIPPNKPLQDLRAQEADPGLPPELAKLGISSADWEKIQTSLKSDVGANESSALPEDYRELVRSYFESISKQPTKD